jgi:hypothetical protein
MEYHCMASIFYLFEIIIFWRKSTMMAPYNIWRQ